MTDHLDEAKACLVKAENSTFADLHISKGLLHALIALVETLRES